MFFSISFSLFLLTTLSIVKRSWKVKIKKQKKNILMLDKIKIIATSWNAFHHWALFVIKKMKIKYVWTLFSAENGFYFYLSHLSSLWFHFFQRMFELEHLALNLGMNFFSLPFDAVNIYSVTMISEYVCSCDNIILKKKENMQSLTMITRNDKE